MPIEAALCGAVMLTARCSGGEETRDFPLPAGYPTAAALRTSATLCGRRVLNRPQWRRCGGCGRRPTPARWHGAGLDCERDAVVTFLATPPPPSTSWRLIEKKVRGPKQVSNLVGSSLQPPLVHAARCAIRLLALRACTAGVACSTACGISQSSHPPDHAPDKIRFVLAAGLGGGCVCARAPDEPASCYSTPPSG